MAQTFIPVFVMTFFISLFILLMQFVWVRIDELVGKGLEFSVLAELFFYAALTFVPLALPLAILLASLMTFGNLGEKFELTAMKAAGVSLIKSMRPLIILIVCISIGAFFFQNNVLPIAQTKMWTLLFSARQKSPEMEIPERTFYDQIPGLNMFVDHKDPETGMLYNLMIYDMSNGSDNTRIIVADSGKISMTVDKAHLLFSIYSGEQFENLRSQTAGVRSNNLPYRRETFEKKDILLQFDANFNRMDDDVMRQQHVGKDITELRATIDSVENRVDSIGANYAREIKQSSYFGLPYYKVSYGPEGRVEALQQPVQLDMPLDIDSLFRRNEGINERSIISQALNKARSMQQEYEYRSYSMEDDRKTIRRHGIELHRKFTLSFACLIFFFIGAPLGAIIRKGGFGLPLIVSVLLFIVYFIIDNMGYKLARDGRMEVYQGIWMSSVVLLPLGVFLTYKAVHDSAVFNFDSYKAFILKLQGKLTRTLEVKEFTLNEVENQIAIEKLVDFDEITMKLYGKYNSTTKLLRPIFRLINKAEFTRMTDAMNELIDYLSNSRKHAVVIQLNKYPFTLRASKLSLIHELNSSLIQWFEKEIAKGADSDVV